MFNDSTVYRLKSQIIFFLSDKNLPSNLGPSKAEVAGRGGVQPPVDCTHSNSPPPAAPARRRPSHPFDTLLKLYRGFVKESRWACLTLETWYGEEQLIFSFSCGQATAAGAAYSSVAPTARRRARKRPPNERTREKERQEEREEQGYFQFSSSSTSSVRTFISFSWEGTFCSPSSSHLFGSLPCSSLHGSSCLCSSHPCSRRSHCSSHPCGSHPQCSSHPCSSRPIAAAITGAASPNAAATPAAATLATATIASALPALAATEALREFTQMAARERRARARTLSLEEKTVFWIHQRLSG